MFPLSEQLFGVYQDYILLCSSKAAVDILSRQRNPQSTFKTFKNV